MHYTCPAIYKVTEKLCMDRGDTFPLNGWHKIIILKRRVSLELPE